MHLHSKEGVPRDIQIRQVAHFAKAVPSYGAGIAKQLGISPVWNLINKLTA